MGRSEPLFCTFLVVLLFLNTSTYAFLPTKSLRSSSVTTRHAIPQTLIDSVLAGATAGAIGIAAAVPLDAIRTKTVLWRDNNNLLSTSSIETPTSTTSGNSPDVMLSSVDTLDNSATLTFTTSSATTTAATTEAKPTTMIDVVRYIWTTEGPAGFFAGVQSMMVSQCLIKAVAFSTNAQLVHSLHEMYPDWSDVRVFLTAACSAGFLASFIVAPTERIAVVMQAQPGKYRSEWECLKTLWQQQGPFQLMTRGLGASIAREVPSDGVYFCLYALLSSQPFITSFLPDAIRPLLLGAISGAMSWIPVYPADVVKLYLQNDDKKTATQVIRDLHQHGGIAAFYDGLEAKLLRAAIHHAVTFEVYEMVMGILHHHPTS